MDNLDVTTVRADIKSILPMDILKDVSHGKLIPETYNGYM
jgi:hypothetical protein